jgi:hypothetical protein
MKTDNSNQLRVRLPDRTVEARLRSVAPELHRDFPNLIHHILLSWLESYEATGDDPFALSLGRKKKEG